MSADDRDLLRRAATVLREHVERLPEPWRSQPWRGVVTDSESVTGVAACVDGARGGVFTAECCEDFETHRQAVAAYVALVGPAVATAIYTWLGCVAIDDGTEPESGPRIKELTAALIVARAVLREPEPKGPAR